MSTLSVEDKRTFRHESMQEPAALADHLIEIAEALRAGSLHLADERGDMSMKPQGLVRFALTGFQEAGQCGVSIALAWRPEQVSPSTLKISRGGGDPDTASDAPDDPNASDRDDRSPEP